jgi:hypothetical protein
MAAGLVHHPYAPNVIDQSLRTYHGVLVGLRYVVLAFIVTASFLILAFCTPAGLLGGGVVALIALGVGLALARDRERPTWLSEFATLFITTSAESGHGQETDR